VVERVEGRVNMGREVEDGCMVMGVRAVVRKGGDGAEEGKREGSWVSMAECRFWEENKYHMAGSNRMEMMERTEKDVDTMHAERIGINNP
jgi:hypothetical protein